MSGWFRLITALVALVASGFCFPCEAENPSVGMSGKLPTATEVFHLRIECAALGRKILDENIIGPALTQSQVSHYEPRSNRYYVEVTVQTTDPARRPNMIDSFLYDGQAGDMLASLHYEGEDHESGMVFDPRHSPTTNTNGFYDDTKAYIDRLMDEGHR
jgi:hypothetical protein